MKKTGKILSLILVLVLVLTVTPVVAFAADLEGSGTEADPYLVTTAEDLASLSNKTAYYKLANDIDLSGYGNWPGINGFAGVFDGDYHTISNLTINRTSMYSGLFLSMSAGAIKNLYLKNVDVNGDSYTGALVGSATSYTTGDSVSINNVVVTGKVVCGNYSGGIVGALKGTISECYADVNVVAKNWNNVGGMIGSALSATIENCYSAGTVTGQASTAGGLAGSASYVYNCYTTAAVSTTASDYLNVGGLAGGITENVVFSGVYALNPTINCGAQAAMRVFGPMASYYTLKGTATDIYARSDMLLNGVVTVNTDSRYNYMANGDDVSVEDLSTSIDNWSAGFQNASVWSFTPGSLPTLKMLENFSGATGPGEPTEPETVNVTGDEGRDVIATVLESAQTGKYFANIAWGGMHFVYSNGVQQWDPTTHTYKNTGVNSTAGWLIDAEDANGDTVGYLDGENNLITVANHSEGAVDVSLSYSMLPGAFNSVEAAAHAAVRGGFYTTNEDALKGALVLTDVEESNDFSEDDYFISLPTANGKAVDDIALVGNVFFAFSGTPDDGRSETVTNQTKVGVITVTFQPK